MNCDIRAPPSKMVLLPAWPIFHRRVIQTLTDMVVLHFQLRKVLYTGILTHINIFLKLFLGRQRQVLRNVVPMQLKHRG